MTIVCQQAPFRRKDRRKTHNCLWQLNLIPWPVNASSWSSAPSLLWLPLLVGHHPLGSCATSSYGEEEEEEETFVSLTLQEPAQYLRVFYLRGNREFICLYFMRWGFKACTGTPLNSKKWSSFYHYRYIRQHSSKGKKFRFNRQSIPIGHSVVLKLITGKRPAPY